MLLRKPVKTVRRKLFINLPSDVSDRLDRLIVAAKAAGLEADVEDAIAAYLVRAIGHAESQLGKQYS